MSDVTPDPLGEDGPHGTYNAPPDPSTCPQCSAEFVPDRPERRYCGPACRVKAREIRKRRARGVMERQPTNRPTPGAWRGARSCHRCSVTFDAARPNARYCSPACAKLQDLQHVRERRAAARPARTCNQCAHTFITTTDKQTYCSARCRQLHGKRPEVRAQWNEHKLEAVACAVCDAPCTRSAWRPVGQRPTCSTTCRLWLQTGWPLSCQLTDRADTLHRTRRRTVTKAVRLLVLALHEAAGRRCSYCDTVTDDVHADHVVPRWLDGPDRLDNLVPACQPCNSAKGRHALAVWATRKHDRLRRFTFDADDARWAHLDPDLLTPVLTLTG